MEHVTLSEHDGGTAVLTVDRPPANAMDLALLRELVEAVEQVAADPPRALVLAGRPGCFSAGADLKAV
ncbi:MAG: enoyl-CoA hydratase/isomerase family protein, partial [Solirubrobacterales bacterium]|nr:enoyl-CoA hydratase/isomerase family protein [Solirubrobacterales bacterium]